MTLQTPQRSRSQQGCFLGARRSGEPDLRVQERPGRGSALLPYLPGQSVSAGPAHRRLSPAPSGARGASGGGAGDGVGQSAGGNGSGQAAESRRARDRALPRGAAAPADELSVAGLVAQIARRTGAGWRVERHWVERTPGEGPREAAPRRRGPGVRLPNRPWRERASLERRDVGAGGEVDRGCPPVGGDCRGEGVGKATARGLADPHA